MGRLTSRVSNYLNEPGYGLRIAGGDPGLERRADLADATTAVLSFDYARELGSSGGAALGADLRRRRCQLDRADHDSQGRPTTACRRASAYDIASYASDSTVLRFESSSDFWGAVTIDNVELSGGTEAQGSDPEAAQTPPGYSHFPALIGADRLHDQGITGAGVSVAVVDTGFWPQRDLVDDSGGAPRFAVRYDAIRKELHLGDDLNGHGTHVTSVLASTARR